MNTIKELAINEIINKLGIESFIMPELLKKPIRIGDNRKDIFVLHNQLINEFFSIVSKIAQTAIKDDQKRIQNILFSEAPAGMTIEYHKGLPECCWNNPIIYRTDESLSGKIYEIQSPGSGWGDLFLLPYCYKNAGYSIPDNVFDFPDLYVNNIIQSTKNPNPKVFHMLDAASVPYSMKYLMKITSSLRYWGISKEVTMHDIDCLISHSVISTTTCNFFEDYLLRAKSGKLVFAIPPNIIFDEKAIFVLPFYRETRNFFSKEIRNLFPFTSIIENNGFFDENDRFISIANFCKRKPRDRKYFLKYGGPNTNKNWGSRSVFRLSGNDCQKLLDSANTLTKEGEIWLIQKDVSKEIPRIITEDIDELIHQKKQYIKFSAYYSPVNLMGVKVMARKHFKVHGQADTSIGIGI